MKTRLLILSFIEGAGVMAAELGGARLLAPVFGSSLYTWATVMGVTLAALASGYFCGSALSANHDKAGRRLQGVMFMAGLSLLLMPLVSFYLVPRISYWPFIPAVLLSSLFLLFPSIFFLGASSPLFIQIQSADRKAGTVSGLIYAVSTAGGIASTFACGFWLIPVWGLDSTEYFFGILTLLATFLILGLRGIGKVLLITGICYLNFQVWGKNKSAWSSDGLLGRLSIVDETRETGITRVLKINDITQSEMDLKTHRSVSPYVTLLDTLIPRNGKGKNALVLGLGAGLSANRMDEKGYQTEGVEVDKRIIDAARNYFFLSANVSVYCDDARRYLNSATKLYDVVISDIFKAEEQPSHVFTLESLRALRKHLSSGGRVYIAWHGYLQGPVGRGTRILLNTLRHAGYHYQIHSTSENEAQRNLLIVASIERQQDERYLVNESVEDEELVNTDMKPLLEKYNATANKSWRTLYLRYYQSAGTTSLNN